MHYILYPDALSLLPRVLETDQLLDLLQKRQLSPEARLFVPDTDTYLPALEHVVLIARERGITPGDLPPLTTDRFAVASATRREFGGEDDSLEWDADTDDISELPLIGAPLRLGADGVRQSGAVKTPEIITPVGLVDGLKNADPRAQHDPHEFLYEHVRRLATISLDTFYSGTDKQVEACLNRYVRALRRQTTGWLLMPLLGFGIHWLLRARSDKRRIRERLEQVGVAELNWQQTLDGDREVRMLTRRVSRVQFASLAVCAFLMILLVMRTDTVARVVNFWKNDSVAMKKTTTAPANGHHTGAPSLTDEPPPASGTKR